MNKNRVKIGAHQNLDGDRDRREREEGRQEDPSSNSIASLSLGLYLCMRYWEFNC
jgi:hypothetical protein